MMNLSDRFRLVCYDDSEPYNIKRYKTVSLEFKELIKLSDEVSEMNRFTFNIDVCLDLKKSLQDFIDWGEKKKSYYNYVNQAENLLEEVEIFIDYNNSF